MRDFGVALEDILDWPWTDEDRELLLIGLRMAYDEGSEEYDVITEVIHKENGGTNS